MSRVALFLPLALLFLADVIPSKAQSETAVAAEQAAAVADAVATAAAGAGEEVQYDVRGNLTLRCPLPNDNSLAYVWKKNGTLLTEVWELAERHVLEQGQAQFRVDRAVEDDFGNYTCEVGGASHTWQVRGRPHLKLPVNSNVVEGQTMKFVCKMTGKPYVRVTWSYSATGEGNFTNLVEAAFGERVHMKDSEQGVPDGELRLAAAARADAGTYRCAAGPARAVTALHVKDMYAALWPFLGICAEVLVLCAVILLYEKRRTKPDLDDSDADTHDQKKS